MLYNHINTNFDDLRSEIYALTELMHDVRGVCGNIPLSDYDRPERLSLYYDYMLKEIGRMLDFMVDILDKTFSLESMVHLKLNSLPIGPALQIAIAKAEAAKIAREAGLAVVERKLGCYIDFF